MDDLTITRIDPERLDDLRPLWLALRDHHGSLTPDWPPTHDDDTSWEKRRRDYTSWLAEPDAFGLVARRNGNDQALGYAITTVNAGSPTWQVDRFGYVETLSVRPEARGAGVGAALLRAVEDHLATLGVVQVELTVLARNADARRFYAREGYDDAFVTVVRRTRRS